YFARCGLAGIKIDTVVIGMLISVREGERRVAGFSCWRAAFLPARPFHIIRKPGSHMSTVRRSNKPLVIFSALSAAVAMALAGTASAQEAAAPTQDSSARSLDRVQVTGSRIKRADVEASLPVTVIQRAEIEAQGITSAEQLLMHLNIGGNGSDNLAANAGIAPADLRGNNGVSGANLRGQGADATLVLLNGRRVAAHGLRGTAVDLNSIPFSAIDRVEVLRDGASAVYGTDAIGGVINFITKTDYTGLQVNAFVDMTEAG